MPVNNQLTGIPIPARGNPQGRKPPLYQQPKNVAGIAPICLLLAHITGTDGGRISDLKTVPHLLQHLFEPLRVAASFHPCQHLPTSQLSIKLLRLLLVCQPDLSYLPGVAIQHRDLLKSRMKIAAYNHHDVGSFLRASSTHNDNLPARPSQRRHEIKRSLPRLSQTE